MNPTILNRDFQHPADGWYMIEPKGEHANKAAGVVQVIDETASESIVNAFRASAQAANFAGMLVDHEHFKHDTDKETRAYGWLTDLQNRTDGIYGQIRWTNTGRAAVDGGDYRFFSTEYDRNDLKVINADKEMRRVRPLRLDGLTLTNSPNNKGGKPITNRTETEEFRRAPGSASVEKTETNKTKNRTMKSIATQLKLSADASEEAVLAEVNKIINRAETAETELPKLKNRVTELETSNATLLGEQVDGLMAECGVKDAKVINRLKPMLGTMKNRAERLECLAEFGFKPAEAGKAAGSQQQRANGNGRMLNREDGKTPEDRGGASASTSGDQQRAEKVTNRARELQGSSPTRSWESCWSQAQRENAGK